MTAILPNAERQEHYYVGLCRIKALYTNEKSNHNLNLLNHLEMAILITIKRSRLDLCEINAQR